jgi:hypothetical protein
MAPSKLPHQNLVGQVDAPLPVDLDRCQSLCMAVILPPEIRHSRPLK